MPAPNSFKGKYNEGLFAGGQGPIHGIQIEKESENTGVLNAPTSGRKLSSQGGKSGNYVLEGSPSDPMFDLHSKSYAGPENWQPKNMGEVSNQPGGK